MIPQVWDFFSNKQKSLYKQEFHAKKYLFKLKTGDKTCSFYQNFQKFNISWTVYP